MIELLFKWQTFFWAMIWAASPFLLWWFAGFISKRNKEKKELYYLERVLVYHINDLLSNRYTIINFIEWNLSSTINDIKMVDSLSYSLHSTFIPLFSIIPINSKVLEINTGSTYIDNKLSYAYNLSQDMPHIIDDTRRQFDSIIENNKILVLWKIQTPEQLSTMYIKNFENFKVTLQDNLLDKNFPTYLKVLVETHEALNYFRKLWFWKWNFKYNTRFRFFKNKKLYNKSLEKIYDNIQESLKDKVDKSLGKYLKD